MTYLCHPTISYVAWNPTWNFRIFIHNISIQCIFGQPFLLQSWLHYAWSTTSRIMWIFWAKLTKKTLFAITLNYRAPRWARCIEAMCATYFIVGPHHNLINEFGATRYGVIFSNVVASMWSGECFCTKGGDRGTWLCCRLWHAFATPLSPCTRTLPWTLHMTFTWCKMNQVGGYLEQFFRL